MSNRFVFVVPCFNAEKTIERMLMSVFLQTYDNWLILIADDMSTDRTISKIQETCMRFNVPWQNYEYELGRNIWLNEKKVLYWKNNEKHWEVKNVLKMINSEVVKDNDIICRLDGDDFLCNLCALKDINFAYNETNAECLWTAHRWSDTWQNISDALPVDANVYEYRWVTSHFKTFRKNLITDVNDENFRGMDGEYIKRAGDQAIYLPVLHKSKRRVFLPTVTYYYTINLSPETFKSEDAKFQLEESNYLRKRGYVE